MTCFASPSTAYSHGGSTRRRGRGPRRGESACAGAGWSAVALIALLVAGCAVPPPWMQPEAPSLPNAVPAEIAVVPRAAVCASCAEHESEIAQLRRRLANTESELSDLRAQRVEQAKALEEANRQAARATARLRRLATRGAAASYIAEVEVLMTTGRSVSGTPKEQAQLAMAREILESSREPFANGDYDAAIDRASHAAEIVAKLTDRSIGPESRSKASAATHFARPVPLRVRIDSHLRNGPSGRAPIRGVLTGGTPLVAHAQRGEWLQVETTDGRLGWVYRPLLEPR